MRGGWLPYLVFLALASHFVHGRDTQAGIKPSRTVWFSLMTRGRFRICPGNLVRLVFQTLSCGYLNMTLYGVDVAGDDGFYLHVRAQVSRTSYHGTH